MKCCGTCKHWALEWPLLGNDEPDSDDIGRCSAMDTVLLPDAWRWCKREVVGVAREEGTMCPCYTRMDYEHEHEHEQPVYNLEGS